MMDDELQQFQDDLLESVKDMKARRIVAILQFPLTPAAEARNNTGLSQKAFATLLSVSRRTLED